MPRRRRAPAPARRRARSRAGCRPGAGRWPRWPPPRGDRQEPRLRGVRPRHEQPDRTVPQQLLACPRALGGHRQRRHAVDVLAGGAQRLAAGASTRRAGTGAQHGLGQTSGRLDQVLAVVEEQQEPLRTDGGADTVGRDAGAGQRQAEHRGHRHRNEIGCRERGELGEQDPVGKRRQQAAGDLQREARLADPPGPGQRDQPMVRHEGRWPHGSRRLGRPAPTRGRGGCSTVVGAARRRLGMSRHTDVARELVAAPGDGANEPAIGAEHLPQHRDLNLEVVLLDHAVGPDPTHELVLAEDRPAPVDQGQEGVERASAELDGSTIDEELAAVRNDPEAAEFDGLRRIRHPAHDARSLHRVTEPRCARATVCVWVWPEPQLPGTSLQDS